MAKKKQADRHKGKMFGVRLPEELADKVKILAYEDNRSFSNFISMLIREAIQARGVQQ